MTFGETVVKATEINITRTNSSAGTTIGATVGAGRYGVFLLISMSVFRGASGTGTSVATSTIGDTVISAAAVSTEIDYNALTGPEIIPVRPGGEVKVSYVISSGSGTGNATIRGILLEYNII